MAKDSWNEEVFNLPPRHRWKAKPGNVVFVADRGAVRFEIPRAWHVEPGDNSVKMYDRKPPDDNMGLEMSVFCLAQVTGGRRVDWRGLSIHELIKDSTADSLTKDDGKVSAPLTIRINGLEIAWVEREFIDPGEKRPAYNRVATARSIAAEVQIVLTLAYWPEDAETAHDVWNDVLGTLKLGEYIENPLLGPPA